MIGFGGLAVYTCNMFLVGILSLARRIKAGIAWKNSFLYSVVEFVKLLIRNARHIAKIIVLYLAYAAVHWVAYLASGWPSAFWSFVIFIVQTAGFVILVNWAVGVSAGRHPWATFMPLSVACECRAAPLGDILAPIRCLRVPPLRPWAAFCPISARLHSLINIFAD